jgi:hypothetical protein
MPGLGQNFSRVLVDAKNGTMVIDGKFADDPPGDRTVEATWVSAKDMAEDDTFTQPHATVTPNALPIAQTNGAQDWLIRKRWDGKPAVGEWIVVNGRIRVDRAPGNIVWSQTIQVEAPPSDKREREAEARGDG